MDSSVRSLPSRFDAPAIGDLPASIPSREEQAAEGFRPRDEFVNAPGAASAVPKPSSGCASAGRKVAGIAAIAAGALAALYAIYTSAKKIVSGGDERPKEKGVEADAFARNDDSDHLQRYDGAVRRTIMTAWTRMSPGDRLAIAREEFGQGAIRGNRVPLIPPPKWSAETARLLEARSLAHPGSVGKSDALLEAGRLRTLGDSFSAIRAFDLAADCYFRSARLYRGVASGEMSFRVVSDVFREAVEAARRTSNLGFAAVLEKEYEKAALTAEILSRFDDVPADAIERLEREGMGISRKAIAVAIAERLVDSPLLGERAYSLEDDGARRASLNPSFKMAAREASAEIAFGLLPEWRRSILDRLYATEDPEYRAFQDSPWYEEAAKEEARDIASRALRILEDPAIRERYIRDGFVTQAGIEAAQSAPPWGPRPVAEAAGRANADDAAAPASGRLGTDSARERMMREILRVWEKEGAISVLLKAIREDRPTVVIDGDNIPVDWIEERFNRSSVSKAVRGLLAEQERNEAIVKAWRALSRGERKALLEEAGKDLVEISGERIAGHWAKAFDSGKGRPASAARAKARAGRRRGADPARTAGK